MTTIDRAFGGNQSFCAVFAKACESPFGSGWAWFVAVGGRLEIRKTSDAETPLTDEDAAPLRCMDVWEHAYSLDARNGRAKHIAAFINHVINWEFANQSLCRP